MSIGGLLGLHMGYALYPQNCKRKSCPTMDEPAWDLQVTHVSPLWATCLMASAFCAQQEEACVPDPS